MEKITKGGEKIASSLTPPATAHYQSPEGLGHDPVLARKLLAEAGYPGGKGFRVIRYLTTNAKTSVQIAVELQEMWKRELGITIEIEQKEWKVYLAEQSSLNYDLSRSSWVGDYNDANTFLDMFMANNGNNRTGWINPRYDALLNQANQLSDVKRRAEILREAEVLLIRDELPIVPLFSDGRKLFRPRKDRGDLFQPAGRASHRPDPPKEMTPCIS